MASSIKVLFFWYISWSSRTNLVTSGSSSWKRIGRETVSRKTSRLNLFSLFARSELVWIRSKPLMGRHLWSVEIPHSCSLAAAPYVILPSVPQKTLKLHLDVDSDSIFGPRKTRVQKSFLCAWRSHADALTSLPFLKDKMLFAGAQHLRGHVAPN